MRASLQTTSWYLAGFKLIFWCHRTWLGVHSLQINVQIARSKLLGVVVQPQPLVLLKRSSLKAQTWLLCLLDKDQYHIKSTENLPQLTISKQATKDSAKLQVATSRCGSREAKTLMKQQ